MKDLIRRYPSLEFCREDIILATKKIIECYKSGGKLLLVGNGGSAADCEHIVGELAKGFLSKRPLSEKKREQMKALSPLISDELLSQLQRGLPAISLPHVCALNSAFSNDVNPEYIYAQGVLAFGKPGDTLIAISTSGNARNVIHAADTARAVGMTVIALSGISGGELKKHSDVAICVPESETYKIQELHLPTYHYICAKIESTLF